MRRLVFLLVLSPFVGALACSAPERAAVPAEAGSAAAASPAPSAPPPGRPSGRPARPEVVFLGDSLTAGLGLDPAQAFPSLIQQRLDDEGLAYDVINAGVSGDTSAGGLRRLEWSLEGDPRVLVVALGGNDGLRGLPPEDLYRNLAAIIEGGQRAGASVILAAMEAPPNNGPEYTAQFRRVYHDLAREYDVPLITFLLDGVAGEPSLNQADGIHPNVEGARRVAETVWQTLAPVLERSPGE